MINVLMMVVVDVTMGVVLVVACGGGGRVRMGMVVVTIVLRFVVNKDHENKVRMLIETLSSNFLSNRKKKENTKEKYGERKKTVIGNEERERERQRPVHKGNMYYFFLAVRSDSRFSSQLSLLCVHCIIN